MNPRSMGRLMAGLLLVQLAGLIVPFILIEPLTSADYLADAAAAHRQIRAAVLLFYANSAVTLAIAIALFRVLRRTSEGTALSLVAVSVIWFVLQAVDNAHILSMVSLSTLYRDAGISNPDLFGALGAATQSARVWAHYAELLTIEIWFFVFYFALFRAALVPRALALFGLLMVVLHALGVTMPKFIGYHAIWSLAPALALSHVAVAGWLFAKGFDEATSDVDRRLATAATST